MVSRQTISRPAETPTGSTRPAVAPALVIVVAAGVLAWLPLAASAQCEAWYRFDGDLNDAESGGYHGAMVGAEGVAATARFTDGVDGRALELDGSSAMRAFVDLHTDTCPQITIAGWLRADPTVTGTQFLVSTGLPDTPGLRSEGRMATLNGPGNGLLERRAFRDPRVWFFFAGVYDYKAGTYRFHWRGRRLEGTLPDTTRPPEDALWIGAQNALLHYAARNVAIDELRIIGQALDEAAIDALRGGRPLAYVAPNPTPAAVVGTGNESTNTTPRVSAEDLPVRSNLPLPLPDVTSTETVADDIQFDPREGVGSGRNPGADPALTPLADHPGTQLREELEAAGDNVPENVFDIHCDIPVVPTLTVHSNATYPQGLINALDQVANCGFYPQVVALNASDQWIVSAGNQIAHSTNLPDQLVGALAEFEATHGQLDAADIATDGTWLIAAGNEFAQSGASVRARARARQVTEGGGRIVSFSLNPDNPAQFLMVDDGGNVHSEVRTPLLELHTAQFPDSQISARQARYLPGGGWILLGTDHWHISEGLRDNQLRNINQLRDAGAGIEHVVGYQAAGRFLILSNGPLPARSSDFIWLVENGLNGSDNIWERMKANFITAAAVAVVRNNEIAWTRGYGLRNASELESYVRPNTRFDFASVSKPIAAFTLMQLVDDPDIEIDIRANGILQDIEAIIPEDELEDFRDNVQPANGNLIQILQHCAALCYGLSPNCHSQFMGGSAKGYDPGIVVPNTAQVLMGSSPAAFNHRLTRSGPIGKVSRYSSANYNPIQALIDIHGGGFIARTNRLFSDLGMGSSTYASPYLGRTAGNFARGHERGVIQPMYGYGELAAASLVSTAADVARFVIAVNQGGGEVLSSDRVEELLGTEGSVMSYCDAPGDMALGFNRRAAHQDWNNNEVWWHNGDHNGYHAKMWGLPGLQSGLVVVMTSNGTDDNGFWDELSESFRDAYGINPTASTFLQGADP